MRWARHHRKLDRDQQVQQHRLLADGEVLPVLVLSGGRWLRWRLLLRIAVATARPAAVTTTTTSSSAAAFSAAAAPAAGDVHLVHE
eukprot:6700736-Prymnesium_polylepis.1